MVLRDYHDAIRATETPTSRQVRQWDDANAMFYGPDCDLKNFPNLKRAMNPPPVKLGLFPQAWFDAFYTKTGVTGRLCHIVYLLCHISTYCIP